MFGHVFQKRSSFPAGYRRLNWIRSDGQSYLDIGFIGPGNIFNNPIGIEMDVLFPTQETVRPGTLFGATGGIDFKLTATAKTLYTPDTAVANGTLQQSGNVGPERCIVTISRNRLGVPTTVTVAADDISRSAQWDGSLEEGDAVIDFADCLDCLCYVRHTSNSGGNTFLIVFSDNPFWYEGTVFLAELTAQQQTGVGYFDHLAVCDCGNLSPRNTQFATAMFADALPKTLRMLWVSYSPMFNPGSDVVTEINGTRYKFSEDGLPEQVTYMQNNLYILARNAGGGADNFCRDMKLLGVRILNVTWPTGPGRDWPSYGAVRTLYPAIRIADNAIGLYDTTVRTFFTSPVGTLEYEELPS